MIIDAAVADLLAEPVCQRLQQRFERMLAAAAASEGSDELVASLRLCDDQVMHELNRTYRGIDHPTDVLAFAQREGEGAHLVPSLLGDIVVSVPTARRQADDHGRELIDELELLVVHGLCHLLGYDHRTDAEERHMNARCARLLAEAVRTGPVCPA